MQILAALLRRRDCKQDNRPVGANYPETTLQDALLKAQENKPYLASPFYLHSRAPLGNS